MDYFTKNGWKIITDLSKADFILLNLCSLNAERRNHHLNYINEIKATKSKNAFLAVTGCISTIASDDIKALAVDAQLKIENIGDLDEILKSYIPLAQIDEPHTISTSLIWCQVKVFLQGYVREKMLGLWKDPASIYDILYYFNLPEEHKLKRAYHVMIAQGCLNQCSYCAIRFARGKLKSIPSDSIIRIVSQGLEEGHTKIHLLGTNPCQYGQDWTGEIDYGELLSRIIQLASDFKLVLPDVDPNYFVMNFERLKVILRNEKFLEITFAVQSASRSVLKRMHRYYDTERFKACVKELRTINPTLKINSHIIIGFPGETCDEFAETFGMIKELDFNKVMLFPYGDLPLTESSTFVDHLEPCEIRTRMHRVYRFLVHASFRRLLLPC